jgi:signal peptidase I
VKRFRVHLVRALALLFVAVLLLSFEIALVPTASMERTVLVGDNVLVFKLLDGPRIPGTSIRLPRLHAPHRGSLVSFVPAAHPTSVFLKRVVALPDDTVEMRGGLLYVNGAVVSESYAPRSSRIPNVASRRLRAGEIFVLGDNRNLSEDSRDFGPIAADSIVGRPIAVVWSSRARTPDLLDNRGNVRLGFYVSAVLHPIESFRWSRIGRLL